MNIAAAPLDSARRELVVAATDDYIRRAAELFGQDFAAIPVHFDLKGRSAGMFKVSHGNCQIRYNPWIFDRYYEENLASTVPHEVAHYIVHELYGFRAVRPHGREWKALMHQFGADASVTCDFDLTGVPQRRERRYSYRCDCRTHQLSARRHNAIQRGQSDYQCRYCFAVLRKDH